MSANVHDGKASTIVLKRQGQHRAIVLGDSTMLLGMKPITPTPSRIALAKNVKRLREIAGLTQMELAKKAGIAQTAISYIENEEGKSPSIETIERVADALGVPHWTLCIPSDDVSRDSMNAAGKVLSVFLHARPDGRAQFHRVADIESRYIALPHIHQ